MTELKEWDNIPRTMWVWDNDEKDMLKMTVVYIIPSECNFPVVALGESGNIYRYRHCAEIVKDQKTSKGFYVYNPTGSKPSHIHKTLEEAKAEAERILKLNLNAGIQEPIEVLEIVTKCVPEIKIKWS